MITVILLAAGNARRFDGSQKLLAPVPHEGLAVPLIRATALGVLGAGLDGIVAVTGKDAARVRAALDGLAIAFVHNQAHATGMSGSLRVGVTEGLRLWPHSEGLLIALGDQPMAGTGIIERVVTGFQDLGARRASKIVVPRFSGVRGNPVLFGRELAPELLAVAGDRGGRGVVDRDPSRVVYVDFDSEPPLDVDTLDDLLALNRLRPR
jgi:molybdenum cofactor cytidylyltransferase